MRTENIAKAAQSGAAGDAAGPGGLCERPPGSLRSPEPPSAGQRHRHAPSGRSELSLSLGNRAGVAPRSLFSVAARQLGHILCSAMRADALTPGFRGQGSRPPCTESPYLDIMTPLYPGLLLGAATILLAGEKTQSRSPGLPFGPGLAVLSPRAAFRGLALRPRSPEPSQPCPARPGQERA